MLTSAVTGGFFTPYSAGQRYGGSLRITNGISGGEIVYRYEVAPASGVFVDAPGTGDVTAPALPSSVLRNIINNTLYVSFRLRAVYTDTPNSVTVTFYSRAVDVPQAATGLGISFTDAAYGAPGAGAVLTANLRDFGFTDPMTTTTSRGILFPILGSGASTMPPRLCR